WGVTYAIWQNLAPLLKSHFQLIMIELPGIGNSPRADAQQPYYQACADAIEEVRQSLGIEQWMVLAYSSGTRAAEAYVQRYSTHVSKVVFLCPLYLPELWALFVYLLEAVRPPQMLKHWLFSDWRLYSFIIALGFNWHRHHYTRLWKEEIELQPLDMLIRTLCEIPGKGRAPFTPLNVPALFIWGTRDVLTARPRRPRANDVFIRADHSAPMLAAPGVAEVVLPFLTENKVVHPYGHRKRWYAKHRTRLEKGEQPDKRKRRLKLLHTLRVASRRRLSLRRQRLLQRARSIYHKNRSS
ncbi:MAG: alpha/beta fold hydrolase, partial [Ktedonobacteraceae bacterium]|nr:alpha/beta fold hydrolase [Ktedonobacteraceae bacterium]